MFIQSQKQQPKLMICLLYDYLKTGFRLFVPTKSTEIISVDFWLKLIFQGLCFRPENQISN